VVTVTDIDVAHRVVAAVTDPEIPSLTIEDMGILRRVELIPGGVRVVITPTYSGCPAMTQIEEDIRVALDTVDAGDVEIQTVFSPAWTTDWMSDSARRKLESEAIAPPVTPTDARCPRCGAANPTMLSEFGTTACKALMVCSNCREAFDLFKELR
jgi:ring-1,2-phenylacetyl-CoA epoxidase subunit PaaD